MKPSQKRQLKRDLSTLAKAFAWLWVGGVVLVILAFLALVVAAMIG